MVVGAVAVDLHRDLHIHHHLLIQEDLHMCILDMGFMVTETTTLIIIMVMIKI